MIETLSPIKALDTGIIPVSDATVADRKKGPSHSPEPARRSTANVSDSGRQSGRFQTVSEVRRDIAGMIRKADESLRTVETNLDKMKEALTHIVKNYPPFPPGSEERVALLKRVVAFRKEIERLTIPPNPFEHLTGGDAFKTQYSNNVIPEVLSIPDLPVDTATDTEIHDAVKQLVKAEEAVFAERNSLAEAAFVVRDKTIFNDTVGDTGPFEDPEAVDKSERLAAALQRVPAGLTGGAGRSEDSLPLMELLSA